MDCTGLRTDNDVPIHCVLNIENWPTKIDDLLIEDGDVPWLSVTNYEVTSSFSWLNPIQSPWNHRAIQGATRACQSGAVEAT